MLWIVALIIPTSQWRMSACVVSSFNILIELGMMHIIDKSDIIIS
jgi:hypothetical protein